MKGLVVYNYNNIHLNYVILYGSRNWLIYGLRKSLDLESTPGVTLFVEVN